MLRYAGAVDGKAHLEDVRGWFVDLRHMSRSQKRKRLLPLSLVETSTLASGPVAPESLRDLGVHLDLADPVTTETVLEPFDQISYRVPASVSVDITDAMTTSAPFTDLS